MKMCFTINQLRKESEIQSFYELFSNNLFQAVEIFYPINTPEGQYEEYTKAINDLFTSFPLLERVLHLPHGNQYSLCDEVKVKENTQIMIKAIKYASMFNVKKLTLHLGLVDQSKARDYYINKIIPILNTLCLEAQKYQMTIMIENMPTKYELGYSPQEILTIIRLVNKSNLKFIFDTGHAHVSEFNDTIYLTLLSDYLYHIHYSDNDGTSDRHAAIGLGTIDFIKHFKVLKQINYQELHCLEIIYHSCDDLKKYLLDFKHVLEKSGDTYEEII